MKEDHMDDDEDLTNEDETTGLDGDPLTDEEGTLPEDEEQVGSALSDDEDDTLVDDEEDVPLAGEDEDL
jgi:hypothetical protein